MAVFVPTLSVAVSDPGHLSVQGYMDTADMCVRNNTLASMSNGTIELLSFLQIHEEEITHIFWSFGIKIISELYIVRFFLFLDSALLQGNVKRTFTHAEKIVKARFYFVSVTSFAQTISSQNSVL